MCISGLFNGFRMERVGMIDLLRRAPARFAKSFGYTWDAVKAMWSKEESFRLETIAGAVLAIVLVACPWPLWKKAAMMAAFLLIPLVEVLNSAIEDICDLITIERNPYVKNAKDKGALAVLLAIILDCGVLLALLLIDD